MSNYLEIPVPVYGKARWLSQLYKDMAARKIPVSWQGKGFHITAAFINNDGPVRELTVAFDGILLMCAAPSLTFDKVDAFLAKSGGMIIVHLTSTRPSPEFTTMVERLREAAVKAGADIDDEFLLHVTLGRIDPKKATLEQVKSVTDGIRVPSFALRLREAEYRYYKGASIRRWFAVDKHFDVGR